MPRMSMQDIVREGQGLRAGLLEAAADLDSHQSDTLDVLGRTLVAAYEASNIAFGYTADRVENIRRGAAVLFEGGGEDAQIINTLVGQAADQAAQLPGLQEAAREAITAAREAVFRLGAATVGAARSAETGAQAIGNYLATRGGA